MSMSRMLVVVSCILLISDPGPAFAGSGWTNFGPITELNQQPAFGTPGAGLVFVEVGVTNNPSGCRSQNQFFFSVIDDRRKRLFDMLLAAKMFARNVRIYTTGNCYVEGETEMDGVIVR
jgi:hypothetical protein